MTADCVCVMLCVAAVDAALAVRPPLAAADAEFAAGLTTDWLQLRLPDCHCLDCLDFTALRDYAARYCWTAARRGTRTAAAR